MELQLIKEEDLIGLTNPWPMKDAADVWQAIRDMTFRQFNVFVLAYMTNLNWKTKRGGPTEFERIARNVLFKMSEKQRAYAYKLIIDKYNKAVENGWWKDDISSLIQPTSKLDINRATHRETGFIRKTLDKKKHIINEHTTIRLKFIELVSIVDQHKEWMLTYVNTTDGHNDVTEYRHSSYEEALKAFNEMNI